MVGKLSTPFLILLLALTTFAMSHAEVELYGGVGFDGYYRSGEWNPVTAYGLTDEGRASGQLVVRLSQTGWPPAEYSTPMLVMSKPVEHNLYVRMPRYPMRSVEAAFVSAGRTRARIRMAPLYPLGDTTPLAVTVRHCPSNLDFLSGKTLGVLHTPAGLHLSAGPMSKRFRDDCYEDSGG